MIKNEKGASAVEYAILLASVALAIYSGVYFFGQTVASKYSHAQQQLETPTAAAPAPAPAAPASPDSGGINGGGGANPASPDGGTNPSSGKYGSHHNRGKKHSMLALK